MEKLMEVRYQDEAQKISLTSYADTLIVDSGKTNWSVSGWAAIRR